ncbi:sugar ABC transporter substrate-binding protein [Oceanobacillus zhaokaii]|uniref:Sugar ABC transporter substrate-binding protein n=1 Tax=Oceanobacillus zhaokaii TaxID=2052660 RepID=A0A345PKH8_9BACI|nr:sugar-binding protein [Oceanobacillus zhaokaii]AXI10508.1 sugar ABC transporter substrate-binding protein [Oceanobacillus zhaokaii]
MSTLTKRILYTISIILFLTSFTVMLYYGYKTFYIKNEPTTSENYTYHFALIAEETENDYWRLIEQGAREAAKENDIFLEYVAPKRADNEHMLRLFDRLIAAKVDGIITQGVEGEQFVDLVHKAVERGIPVITIDTDVKSSERNAYVGTDNFYAGRLAGRTIIENTMGKQYIGIVTGRLDAINQQQRIEGLKEEIASHPRIQIVDTKESNITRIGATQATYELLKKHPEINVLVGTSSLDGIGMVKGLEEIAPNKEVYITAFDVLPRTLDLIRSNKIDATIAQYPIEMGNKSVKVMIELQEQVLLNNEIFTETRILGKDDVLQSSGATR